MTRASRAITAELGCPGILVEARLSVALCSLADLDLLGGERVVDDCLPAFGNFDAIEDDVESPDPEVHPIGARREAS